MLTFLKKRLLALITALWSLLNALFWLALRVNWAGISKFMGADKNQSFIIMQAPLMVCILMWVIFAVAFVLMLCVKRKKLPFIILLAIDALMAGAIVAVIIFGANDYIQFILPKFINSLLCTAGLVAVALLAFTPLNQKRKWLVAIKGVCLLAVVAVTVVLGYGIVFCNSFTYEPVVYAVEDSYQIVFSTADQSIAWVQVGDNRYYDLYAGSMRSNDLVHKVTVPQSELDAHGGYSIHAKQMIYRGPFGGYVGEEINKAYSFKPVDSSDGLVYYSLSDVHHALEGAVAAAKQVKDMDFLVILGDSTSMVDRYCDAQFANELAFAITQGQIPVVYARGNHEIKGIYAEELYKYVGSKNGNFYYEFTLSDVYGVVLDLGEDHDDDWWEYYGTAQFVQYQAEQTAMLRQAVDEEHSKGYNYTLVACHIPIQYVNYRHNHESIKAQWTGLLNSLKPDLAVYGHQHELYPFIAGTFKNNSEGQLSYNSQFRQGSYSGYVTDFEFNSFIVGRRGSTQTDEVSSGNTTEHIGLVTVASIQDKTQLSYYINSRGNRVEVFNPFVEGPAQTEFATALLD